MSVKEQAFAALKAQPKVRMDITMLLQLCDEAENTTQIAESCHRLINSKGSGIQRDKSRKGRFEYWFDPALVATPFPESTQKAVTQSQPTTSEAEEIQSQIAHQNKIIDDQRAMIKSLREQAEVHAEEAAGLLYPEPHYYLVCVEFERFDRLDDARSYAESRLAQHNAVVISAPLMIAEKTVTWKAVE